MNDRTMIPINSPGMAAIDSVTNCRCGAKRIDRDVCEAVKRRLRFSDKPSPVPAPNN